MENTLTNATNVANIATLQQWGYGYAVKIILALLILLIGRWLARIARKGVQSVMARRKADPIVVSFASNITHFSAKETRRVDLTFGVSYSDDLRRVKEVLKNIVESDPRVLKQPVPSIGVSALGDNSVNLDVKVWVATSDCGAVKSDLVER